MCLVRLQQALRIEFASQIFCPKVPRSYLGAQEICGQNVVPTKKKKTHTLTQNKHPSIPGQVPEPMANGFHTYTHTEKILKQQHKGHSGPVGLPQPNSPKAWLGNYNEKIISNLRN